MENSSNSGMRPGQQGDRSNNQGQNLDHDNDNMQNMSSSSDAVKQQRDPSWDDENAQQTPMQSARQGEMAGDEGHKSENTQDDEAMDSGYDMNNRDRNQGSERIESQNRQNNSWDDDDRSTSSPSQDL